MICSFSRPVSIKKPSASRLPRSPVRKRPRLWTLHLAIVAEIAERVIGKSAEFDITDFTGGQAPAFGIDDGQIVICAAAVRPCRDAAFARNSGYPARFAGAATLGDRNAELLLEPFPFFEQQRRRTRGNKAQVRQTVAMCALSLLSRMLIVVGLPVAIVTPCSRI